MNYRVVRNVTNGSMVVDNNGTLAMPGDWTLVRDNPFLQAAIGSGGVVDKTEFITDKSDPAAYALLLEGQRLSAAEDARPVLREGATSMSTGDASPDPADD